LTSSGEREFFFQADSRSGSPYCFFYEPVATCFARESPFSIKLASFQASGVAHMVIPSGKNLTYYNAPAAAIQYEQAIFQL